MKSTIVLAAALVATAFSQPLFAAGNPWLGTWKLNTEKSSMTAQTFTIVKTGAGYTFEFGSLKFFLGDDGKDYPTTPGRTGSLKQTAANEWLRVSKVNGVETSRNLMTLSGDGRTQTEKITGTQADGKTYKAEWIDERVSGGPGLAGVWKGKSKSSEQDTMTYSDAGNGMLRVEHAEDKSTMTISLDGKPARLTGPREDATETYRYSKVSPNEVKYTVYMKDKPFIEGLETVSADGRVLKDVSWAVSTPAEKETQIYDKQ